MNQERLQQLYQELLCEQKIEKFSDYFSDDCKIVINNKMFDADGFKKRMQWIKDTTKVVNVEIIRFIQSADGKQISDTHITTVIGKDDQQRKVLVMQHSIIVGNKIKDFLDASYLLEGEQSDYSMINAN